MSLFKKKGHKHKWKTAGHAVLKDRKGRDHLRLIVICEKCMECAHLPVPSYNEFLKRGARFKY